MTPQLRTWSDGLASNLVADAWPLRHDRERLIARCRKFEKDYLRLKSSILVEAREQVLETARHAWPVESNRDKAAA